MDDLTEKKRLQAQNRLFERMVSPAVINMLDPDKLQLGGKQAQISILFADIRDFTQFSEKTQPAELVKILNHYLAIAADSILAQQGTIDKFLGDAVMAWFNAPIPQPDHTLRAVRAALGIRDAIHNLKKHIPTNITIYLSAQVFILATPSWVWLELRKGSITQLLAIASIQPSASRKTQPPTKF